MDPLTALFFVSLFLRRAQGFDEEEKRTSLKIAEQVGKFYKVKNTTIDRINTVMLDTNIKELKDLYIQNGLMMFITLGMMLFYF
jgi:hypothetical protein